MSIPIQFLLATAIKAVVRAFSAMKTVKAGRKGGGHGVFHVRLNAGGARENSPGPATPEDGTNSASPPSGVPRFKDDPKAAHLRYQKTWRRKHRELKRLQGKVSYWRKKLAGLTRSSNVWKPAVNPLTPEERALMEEGVLRYESRFEGRIGARGRPVKYPLGADAEIRFAKRAMLQISGVNSVARGK